MPQLFGSWLPWTDACTGPLPVAPLTCGLTCGDTCFCPSFSCVLSASHPDSSPEGPAMLPQDPASSHQQHLHRRDPNVFVLCRCRPAQPCWQWSYLPSPPCRAGPCPLLVFRLSPSLPAHASGHEPSVATTLRPGPLGKPLPHPRACRCFCQPGTRPF